MALNPSQKLKAFHSKAEMLSGPLTTNLLNFRFVLLQEEIKELIEAFIPLYEQSRLNILDRNYLPLEEVRVLKEHLLKELCDVVYVLVGTAVQFNWDFDKAFTLVHANNMTKVKDGLKKNKSGKVLKPKGYKPVDLGGCL